MTEEPKDEERTEKPEEAKEEKRDQMLQHIYAQVVGYKDTVQDPEATKQLGVPTLNAKATLYRIRPIGSAKNIAP